MKVIIALYGLLSYVIGIAGLVYFILYVGNFEFMPHRIESGVPGSLWLALMVNTALMVLFGVQHTVMARPSFKAVWTRLVPQPAERPTYTMLSGVMMVMLAVFWQPMAGSFWNVESGWLYYLLVGGFVFGWFFCVSATFLINHFELFGLQQVYDNFRSSPERTPTFGERGYYRLVRHPIQTGVLIGIWITPVMSMTHFYLAFTMTVYIFIGLYFEERNLIEELGDEYSSYKARVSKLIPMPKIR